MRVIIIGAGDAGQKLAEGLINDGHEVVIVDRSKQILEEAENQFDLLTVLGGGASPATLEEAGVDRADLMLAVSNSNETNLLACLFAKQAGVRFTVARITRPEYDRVEYRAMGVDLLVNEHEACARELEHVLLIPAALEVADLFEGRVIGAGMMVSTISPLLRSTLDAYDDPTIFDKVRMVVCKRGEETFIPSGSTRLMVGDEVYVVGRPEDVSSFAAWIDPERQAFTRVVIGGGGSLGKPLVNRLHKLCEVIILEKDPEIADRLSGELEGGTVVCGDMLDQEIMENCGFHETSAYIATTGSDQDNMVSCVLAEKQGVTFTAARISRRQFVPLIDYLKMMDRVVNPYLALFNAISHYMQDQNVHADTHLQGIEGEFLEYEIKAGHGWVGKQVQAFEMPKGSILAMILRGEEEVLMASGSVVLQPDDLVAVYALAHAVPEVKEMFAREAEGG